MNGSSPLIINKEPPYSPPSSPSFRCDSPNLDNDRHHNQHHTNVYINNPLHTTTPPSPTSPLISPRRSPKPSHTPLTASGMPSPKPTHNGTLHSPRERTISADNNSSPLHPPKHVHFNPTPLSPMISSPVSSRKVDEAINGNNNSIYTSPLSIRHHQDIPDPTERPRSALKLTINDFTLLEKIGQGGFGAVYLARKNDNGEVVALKRMEKSFILQKNRERHVMNERDALVQARDNPWLVSILYSFQDPLNLYIAMEFVPGGDMRSLIEAFGLFEEDDARFYVAEMVEAVRACHALGYCHRDIKPENFLIDASGHIKLADFGLSKSGVDMYLSKLHSKSASLSNSMSDLATIKDKSGKNLAYSVVGSPLYMAPEVVQQLGYGLEADYWSVGVILYELLSGDPPFTSDSPEEVLRMLSEWQHHLKLPRNVSVKAWDLIQGLIARPSARLTANQIIEHPFFDGIDWDTLRTSEPPFVPVLESDTDTSYYNSSPADRHYDKMTGSPLGGSSEKSILGFSFPRNSYDLKAMEVILREINNNNNNENTNTNSSSVG